MRVWIDRIRLVTVDDFFAKLTFVDSKSIYRLENLYFFLENIYAKFVKRYYYKYFDPIRAQLISTRLSQLITYDKI